jgi:hypothetical protein
MRDKRINEKLHRITYWLKNMNVNENVEFTYEFIHIENVNHEERLIEIDINKTEHSSLKKIVYDFQYLNKESFEDVKIFSLLNEDSIYLIRGKTNVVKVQINS